MQFSLLIPCFGCFSCQQIHSKKCPIPKVSYLEKGKIVAYEQCDFQLKIQVSLMSWLSYIVTHKYVSDGL